MKPSAILMALSTSLVLASFTGLSAKEFNQRPHLDPGSQAKVNAVIAGGRKDRASDLSPNRRIINRGCGNLIVGNSNDSKRPPREVIIVARDIINVGGNC